jgi:hypothetical protein
MMNEFEFGFELQLAALAVVLLLIIVLIFLIVRKRINNKRHEISELAKQTEAFELASEPIGDVKPKTDSLAAPQAEAPLSSNKPNEETQTNEALITSKFKNLPQDSMLRRHYLTNLHTMIESLYLPRPTEFNLCRHYDSMLTAEIEQCLSDEAAMERLISKYEGHKKTLTQQKPALNVITEPLTNAVVSGQDSDAKTEKLLLPEDSMLRRHMMTHLYALVEANMPIRPTDSVLLRHYNTMIENEVNKYL